MPCEEEGDARSSASREVYPLCPLGERVGGSVCGGGGGGGGGVKGRVEGVGITPDIVLQPRRVAHGDRVPQDVLDLHACMAVLHLICMHVLDLHACMHGGVVDCDVYARVCLHGVRQARAWRAAWRLVTGGVCVFLPTRPASARHASVWGGGERTTSKGVGRKWLEDVLTPSLAG